MIRSVFLPFTSVALIYQYIVSQNIKQSDAPSVKKVNRLMDNLKDIQGHNDSKGQVMYSLATKILQEHLTPV